jgi:uncharacterized membrane protein
MAREGNDSILMTAAALGALSGIRSMAGPMLITQALPESQGDGGAAGLVERLITSDGAARLLAVLASGEMLADKSSRIPDRTDALPLMGRALLGSLSAATYAVHRRKAVLAPAAVGAAAAVVSTFAAYHIRQFATHDLRIPNRLMGLIEDAVVVAVGRRVAASLEQ